MSVRNALGQLASLNNRNNVLGGGGRSITTSAASPWNKTMRCTSANTTFSSNYLSDQRSPPLLHTSLLGHSVEMNCHSTMMNNVRAFSCASSSSQQPFEKALEIFPGSLTNAELVSKISATLQQQSGFENQETTLVATSLCCDEVNRTLENDLADAYTANFNMGGLAGFPFGGATSFGAMAAHIPDGGSCLVVYGPHVGVDSTGAVGTVERRGKEHGGSCCGSAVAASNYVAGVHSGKEEESPMPSDALDAQQYFVGQMLLPYADRLEGASDKMVELPHALYDAQSSLMERIVQASAAGVGEEGRIALLGGIQINTPPGFIDYFLPMRFDLFDNNGEMKQKLW